MARRAWWPTVETSEATIFARGIVTPATCALAGADCCDPPAAQSGCCPDGFEEVLLFSALGPLGADFAAALLEYELNWAAERGSWIGGTEGENGEAIAFETYCVEDEEFGTLWVIAGSYFAVELGVRVPFFVFGVLPGDGTIVAEVEVPGSDTPLTIAITHPCPTEANGGGSGGSGSGDPIPCPGVCGPTVAAVTDKTGDATCLPDTMTYAGSGGGYIGRWTTATCPGNLTYELRCEGGVFKFYAGATECAFVTGTASPLSLTFQLPDLGANVGGAGGTAKVTLTC